MNILCLGYDRCYLDLQFSLTYTLTFNIADTIYGRIVWKKTIIMKNNRVIWHVTCHCIVVFVSLLTRKPNAKVSARQPWYIGCNVINRPHLRLPRNVNVIYTSFLRYCDLLAENCVFSIALSYSAPPLPTFPLELHGEFKRQKTRVVRLLCGEGCMILTSTVFDWSTCVTDGRTTAYSAL